MSRAARRAARLYGALLRLYPTRYRAEFGEEMRGVFEAAAGEAAAHGPGALAGLCLRELRDLPGALLAEHARELRMTRSWTPRHEDQPGTWGQAAGAALPHLLVAAAFSLPSLLLAGVPAGGFLQVALPLLFLLCIGLGLLAGWRRGWPRWSAGWLAYALILGVVLVSDRLLNGFGGVGGGFQWNSLSYLGQRMLSDVVLVVAVVALLYTIAHRDMVMGLIAVLPLAHLSWLFHLEFVPAAPQAAVILAAWAAIGLAAAAMVRSGRRDGAVWLALGASALVGLMYSFGAVYLSEVEAFGPRTPQSVWRQFAPDFFGGAALLLGLPLGRRLWEHARLSGRLGRLGFGLALAGFLTSVAGMLAAYRLFLPDDLAGFRPLLGPWLWLAVLVGAQAYAAGAALIAFASWKAQRPAERAAFVLLTALLFAAPLAQQLPRVLATRTVPLPLPTVGDLLRLPVRPEAALLLAALWLALAAWLAARPVREAGLGIRG